MTEVEERLQAAAQRLADAEGILAEGYTTAAVHMAYYAAFHAARALLSLEDSRPKTHRGIVSEIQRLFVRSGRMEGRVASRLAHALESRLAADYDVGPEPTEEEAREILADAQVFVEAARRLLKG